MTRALDTTCPNCGQSWSAQTAVTKADATDAPSPMAGSVSLCVGCGVFSVFDEQLHLRMPSASEAAVLEQDPLLKHMRAAWRIGVEKVGKPRRDRTRAS